MYNIMMYVIYVHYNYVIMLPIICVAVYIYIARYHCYNIIKLI